MVWYAETSVKPNKLVRFDPRTQQVYSRQLLLAEAWCAIWLQRRMGAFTLACSGVNKVAVVQP